MAFSSTQIRSLMGRRTNQPRDTKWADIKINHGIQNGQTHKLTTGYEMGGRTNYPRDTKWADIKINHGIRNGQT